MAFDEGLAHIMYVGIYLATMKYCLCTNGRSVEELQAGEHVHTQAAKQPSSQAAKQPSSQAAKQPYIMSLEVDASSVHTHMYTCHQ